MSAKVHERKPIFSGRVFNLVTETVTLSNGTRAELDVIEHPGATAIVPFIDSDHILMLRQYRHAVKTDLWEIPAGTLDPQENELQCARRELTEETGYEAAEWQKMGEIVPVPGYSNERIHMYLATGLEKAEQNLDEDEVIEVQRIAFDEAFAMIQRGDVQDAKTICGLYLAQQYLTR
jgi:ADP-ribose pyrophosphatase